MADQTLMPGCFPPIPRAEYLRAGELYDGSPEQWRLWYERPDVDGTTGAFVIPADLARALLAEAPRALAPLTVLHRHPEFDAFGPWVHRELYGRDGKQGRPRRRFELADNTPVAYVRKLLELKCACAACGRVIRPFRQRMPAETKTRRKNKPNVYVAVACPLEVRMGCSRGDAARGAYLDLELALVERKLLEPTL